MRWKPICLLFSGALALSVFNWPAEVLGQQRAVPAQSGQQGTFWVTSVPAGLKVYLLPDVEPTTEKKEDGYVSIVEKHIVIDERNLKGVTPLTLRVASGKYLVAIAPVIVLDTKTHETQIDQTLTPRALVSFESLKVTSSLGGGLPEKAFSGAAVYPVEKLAGVPKKLVLLAVTGDATLDTLESIYPSERNFSFDEAAVSGKLTDAKIPEGDLSRVLSLLHRGGKVVLVRGDIRWKVVMSDNGTSTIETQVRGR